MFRRDPFAQPEELIRRVYAYVAYRIGPGPDAEDVTSETLERALRYRSTYKPSLGPPIAWLIGIARRCIADAYSGTAPPEAYAAPPAVELERDSLRRLTLNACIARLGERDRELLALRYGSDLTAREIAAVLGAETNAVEVALHRAVLRLRELLERADERPAATNRL